MVANLSPWLKPGDPAASRRDGDNRPMLPAIQDQIPPVAAIDAHVSQH